MQLCVVVRVAALLAVASGSGLRGAGSVSGFGQAEANSTVPTDANSIRGWQEEVNFNMRATDGCIWADDWDFDNGKTQSCNFRGDDAYGVIFRSLFDGLPENYDYKVGTFWSNDIWPISQAYAGVCDDDNNCIDAFPSYWTSNGQEWKDGNVYGETDPYKFAVVGVVITNGRMNLEKQTGLNGDGRAQPVLYAHDSNAVDHRCNFQDGQFKCSSSAGPAPYGLGCHANVSPDSSPGDCVNGSCVNQWHAWDTSRKFTSRNGDLVKDPSCRCNDISGNGNWYQWVYTWSRNACLPTDGSQQYPVGDCGGEYYYMGDQQRPSWTMDFSACAQQSVNDMINLQNALWHMSFTIALDSDFTAWDNRVVPYHETGREGFHDDIVEGDTARRYWGWNEVPLRAKYSDDPKWWAGIAVKLPALLNGTGAQDSPDMLCDAAQRILERDLEKNLNKADPTRGDVKVAFVRESLSDGSELPGVPIWKFNRDLFCQIGWTSLNSKFLMYLDSSTGDCMMKWL